MRQTVRVDYCFLIWHSHNSLCLCDCASSMIPILSFCFYFAVRLRRHYFSLLREKNSPQGTFHPKRSFIQREVSPQGKFYPEGRFTPREVSPQGTFHPQRPFTSKKKLTDLPRMCLFLLYNILSSPLLWNVAWSEISPTLRKPFHFSVKDSCCTFFGTFCFFIKIPWKCKTPLFSHPSHK